MNHALVSGSTRCRLTAAALLLLAAQAAAAGPPGRLVAMSDPAQLKRLSVEELLQQDVVSVSRRPEPWAQAPSSVYLIDDRAVRMTDALTLPDLLRLAPNLFVAQANSYHWAVEARGFTRTNAYSNKLLVLVDGRTVYSPFYSNVFWDGTDVFLPDLASVEVISGPAGANWGANAVNGVINLTSKSAHETIGGLAEASVGPDLTQFAVRQGFKFGANGAMRVYAKHQERGASRGPTGGDDAMDAWHAAAGGFRADWGVADAGGAFTVQGDGYQGRLDARPAAPVRHDTGNLLARYVRDFAGGDQFWVRAYYDYLRRDTSGALTETTHTYDVEFQYSHLIGSRQSLLLGANLRRIDDRGDHTADGFVILPERLWFNLGGAFVQHEVSFAGDSLRLTTGARLEHNHFTGWEVQPTAKLAWHGTRDTVWVAASRATRTPSRLESGFYAPKQPPYFVAGGPGFASETLNAYELGWRGQPRRGLAVTTTAYLHDYDHLRTVELRTPIVQANGGLGRSYGLEANLDYDVTPNWQLNLGGFVMKQETWLRRWSTDTGHGEGESSFPQHQLFLRSTVRLTDRTEAWLSLRTVAAVPASEFGGGRVPAYTELDACLRWRFRPDWELSLAGRNLLDRFHPEIGGLDNRREIPRSVYLTLRVEY